MLIMLLFFMILLDSSQPVHTVFNACLYVFHRLSMFFSISLPQMKTLKFSVGKANEIQVALDSRELEFSIRRYPLSAPVVRCPGDSSMGLDCVLTAKCQETRTNTRPSNIKNTSPQQQQKHEVSKIIVTHRNSS